MEKMADMSLYEKLENNLIEFFMKDVKEHKINPENTDLLSPVAQVKYQKYIRTLADYHPHEYKNYEFKKMPSQEVLKLFIYIIQKIFNSPSINEEIKEYISTLACSGSDESLNGVALSCQIEGQKDMKRITQISSLDRTCSIISLVHEFIHFHTSKIKMDFNKKRYYEEILSIYAEKLATRMLSYYEIEADLIRKIEETRMDSIVWHNIEHPKEISYVISSYETTKFLPKDAEANYYISLLEENLPWIKTAATITGARQYKKNIADSYGIGALYAESLLRCQIEDVSTTTLKVKKVLFGEEKLQDMLDYFGINASSSKTYENVNQLINTLKKNR